MKLSVLPENTASGNFTAEHGLSYFIEHGNNNLLFDTGHTDVYLKNAKKLNIPIETTETVVLSHGHWDHGNGLKYIKDKTLICHPSAFIKRYRKFDNSYIGLDSSFEELEKKFEVVLSKIPLPISDEIIFLGEIPGMIPFEAQDTSFIFENEKEDFVPDDSALAIIENNELVIITGCSHSGVCNIIEYAK